MSVLPKRIMGTVSVIIPCHNRKDLLLETLQNLTSQSHVPEEIIVVDDHSTDGTFESVQSLYPQVNVQRCVQRGPGAARNTGMVVSNGQFIKFMDSDDLLTLNSIEDQVEMLEKSTAQLVHSPYFKASLHDLNWEQQDEIMHYYPIPPKKDILKWIMKGFFIPIPTMMFRRSFLEKIGSWNEDLTAYEDFEYFWRINVLHPQYLHSNRSAMLYRIHGSQTTEANTTNIEKVNDKIISLKKVILMAGSEKSLNKFDREFLKVQLRHALVFSKEKDLEIPGGLLNRCAEYFMRIEKKIWKLRTGSNWLRLYGTSNNKKILQNYLEHLNNSQT